MNHEKPAIKFVVSFNNKTKADYVLRRMQVKTDEKPQLVASFLFLNHVKHAISVLFSKQFLSILMCFLIESTNLKIF